MQAPQTKRAEILLTFAILWSGATILGLTWGIRYDFPDNVHLRHGLPGTWGIHVLQTIAGPVDLWLVDLSALLIDLIFWLGIMVGVLAIPLLRRH